MDLKTVLSQELRHINTHTDQLKADLKTCPAGALRLTKNGRSFRWRQVFPDRSRIELKKADLPTAQQLVKKDFLTSFLAFRERQASMITNFLNAYPDTFVYPDPSSPAYEEIHKLFKPAQNDQNRIIESWLSQKTETNQDYPEQRTIPTKVGFKVRSKSECLIADALFDRRIPFRYEQIHRVGGIKLSPDFTILSPRDCQNVILWEHFGLMDDNRYANSMRAKLGTYLEAGFVPGKNLIMTFEGKDWPLDINYVLLLISYYFE